MRLIVTRPAPQAAAWVQRLQSQGLDAAALPLLRIQAVADDAPLQRAWDAIAGAHFRLVVFVSPNAVARFFDARLGRPWPATTRAGVPGPGSAGALCAAGVPASAIVEPAADAVQFDSEALWAQLRPSDWLGAPVLVVRGDGGREWLVDTLRDAGARVQVVQAYARAAPAPDAAERRVLADALARPQGQLWLFSSSEAVGHLGSLAAAADWSASRALASHPRIAERARALGFGELHEAPPGFDSVLAAARRLAGA